MDCALESVGSTLSWNTFLSRTSVSTLTCAIFSERQSQSVNGLEDVIRAVGSLHLRRYRYEELVREETLGEGETYLVEKAVQNGTVFAIKHLKISNTPDEKTFRRRLSAVTVEAQIMRHSPLRAHPNLPTVVGYGWNLRGKLIMPFLVVEYAPLGTLREYIQKAAPAFSDIEILLGDVASALAALHVCGIVHGDVKLDNVLVFPSMDRPAKALAQLTDFGHALILSNKSKKKGDETVTYGGTMIYNAPEVRTQALIPIDRTEVCKCDIWAFGLLVWEACIRGEEYIKYLARSGVAANTSGNDPGINAAEMLHHATRCLPKGRLGSVMFLRIVLHKTIQEDPTKRAASIQDLPLSARWKTGDLLGLEADLALHFEAPTPTYEMFRLDTGKEILWDHQRQIFQGLKQTLTNNVSSQIGPISWQIALCYHVGFGTTQDAQNAHKYSEMARSEFHPLAMAFGHLLDPYENGPSESPEESYAMKISSLLRSDLRYSEAMPSLVKAFFDGNSAAIFDLLSKGISLSFSSVDGCSPFHWLFMLQDTVLDEIIDNLSGKLDERLVNLPMHSKGPVHDQWPLQLSGSPLAVAISVNSLPAVKALLSLGADPFSLVYDRTQFPANDSRSQWTAFHVAAKYHCSKILSCLLEQTKSRQQTSINSLACVLSLSTAIERLAMHGSNQTNELDETVRLISMTQPLGAMDLSGRTGLMIAIDFQDYHVVAGLLRSNRGLAKIPFRSPKSPDIFTYPIHFSAQIGARRDIPETLNIPKLIRSCADGISARAFSRDHMGNTPLHLAVTGPSSAVAGWILEENVELVQVEDVLGRTPLYYCASSANLNLLLDKGADFNHFDKRGATALHRVCYVGASDLVTCLLKRKPRLDVRDDIFGTPLHCGVISGAIDVVMALVEAGAPLNAVDVNGNTAVHVAAKLNRHSILRVLIQQGADISLRNINGRDQKAMSLHAAKGSSMLHILQHEDTDAYEPKPIIEEIDDDGNMAGFVNQSTSNHSPDFLWEKEYMSVTKPDESTYLWQSADDDPYVYGEQQETYDQREEKLQKLDEITSTVTGYLPNLHRNRKAATAVVALLSVFFDDIVWQPGIASRMVEVIARAAHDLAYTTYYYVKKATHIQQRAEAWAGFLTTHNGILLKNKKQLGWFWSHMEENDPIGTPDQADKEPEYWPNNTIWRLAAGGVFRKHPSPSQYFGQQVALQPLLHHMEKTFLLDAEEEPAHSNRDLEDLTQIKIRYNMAEESETTLAGGWKISALENQNRDAEVGREIVKRIAAKLQQEADRIREVERRKGESSLDESRWEEQQQEPQADDPELDDPWCQEDTSYFDHVNLAIDWITTIVMDRKPRTIFPGRQKSDIEDMARWEIGTWEIRVPNCRVPKYSRSLFDHFPQLMEKPWRENSSREYLKWKHKKAFVFLREEHEDERPARMEFFARVYASCIRIMEDEQFDVDDVDIESENTSKPWLGKAKEKLKEFKEIC